MKASLHVAYPGSQAPGPTMLASRVAGTTKGTTIVMQRGATSRLSVAVHR